MCESHAVPLPHREKCFLPQERRNRFTVGGHVWWVWNGRGASHWFQASASDSRWTWPLMEVQRQQEGFPQLAADASLKRSHLWPDGTAPKSCRFILHLGNIREGEAGFRRWKSTNRLLHLSCAIRSVTANSASMQQLRVWVMLAAQRDG